MTSRRERLVAATMLELSKTAAQAEGDVIAETADLIRANVANTRAVADVQPASPDGVRNRLDYRPLEGFVLAVSPFNYASMNHLALGPALLGNVVVWKPAEATALVSHLMLSLLREAGLPDGVINLVHGDGAEIAEVALAHRDLAAVHFTGSTATFRHLFRTVGANVDRYRGYPRVVGETGGKGFVARPPLGRSPGAHGRGGGRRLRLPGPEVLGRDPSLPTAFGVARIPRPAGCTYGGADPG